MGHRFSFPVELLAVASGSYCCPGSRSPLLGRWLRPLSDAAPVPHYVFKPKFVTDFVDFFKTIPNELTNPETEFTA